MAMVDVDGSCHFFPADSQSKSAGLVWGLAATSALSLYSSNEPGEHSQWLCHDDSAINITSAIIIPCVWNINSTPRIIMQTRRRGGRQPSDQANRLGLWVCQKEMAAIVHIHHRHLLLLSPIADTHFTVPRRVEGWVDLGTAVRVCSPCPRLYIAVAVVINTTAGGKIQTWVLSHRSQACYN